MSLGPPTLGWRQGLSIDLFPLRLLYQHVIFSLISK